jgi:hypothetical protein
MPESRKRIRQGVKSAFQGLEFANYVQQFSEKGYRNALLGLEKTMSIVTVIGCVELPRYYRRIAE